MGKIDFAAINRALLAEAERLVSDWLPDGRRSGAEYQPLNPLRPDASPGSFSININTGVWKDFATDSAGSDLISLYAYIQGLTQGEAAKRLSDSLGINTVISDAGRSGETSSQQKSKTVWAPVFPVPASAPPIPESHYRYGKPSRSWEYLDAQGRLLCHVLRFDPEGERKVFCPLTWCTSQTGRAKWAFIVPPAPRPLYGLDRLAARPSAPVILCEGEKSADAAADLLPEFVAISSMGGSSASAKVDWSPLRGRAVTIWPDADDPGRKFAELVSQKLLAMGDTGVQWVRVPDGKPEGWDAADAVAEGWTSDRVQGLIQLGEFFTQPEIKIPKPIQQPPTQAVPFEFNRDAPPWPLVPNYIIDEHGVRDASLAYICYKPAWVSGMTKNMFGQWGIQLRFFDHDWQIKTVSLPQRILNEQGGVLGREMADMGFAVVPGKEKMVARFLAQQIPGAQNRVFASTRLGWYDNNDGDIAFILPAGNLGETRTEITYQPESYSRTIDNLRHASTLEEWQRHVRDRARGNPFLEFAILIGLAGPLLKLARVENGGFNFYGLSTGGKTTMGQCCASVWGCGADPSMGPEHTIIQTWDATNNALEVFAETFNDLAIVLDEIGKADAHDVGRSIYKITGGLAKGRSTLGGGLRSQRTWRLLVLSTGELSIRQVFAQFGGQLKAGQRVRFPDIPVDDDQGRRSIIQDIHGSTSAEDFCDALKEACGKYYGVAGPAFVAYLIGQSKKYGYTKFMAHLGEEMRYMEGALCCRPDPKTGKPVDMGLPEELRRVIKRFAVVALAGAHAHAAGILDWPVFPTIIQTVRLVRDAWLTEQGESRSEIERAIAHLCDGIARHIARFVPIDASPSLGMRDVLGYRGKDALMRNFFVLPEKGLRELCGDYDPFAVLRELRNRKLLWHDDEKLVHKCPRVPSLGNTRPYYYWISARIFGEEDEAPPLLDDTGDGVPF